MKKKKLYFLLTIFMSLACDQTRKSQVNISVLDNNGRPLSDASIYLSNKFLRVTDRNGLAMVQVDVGERPMSLEITKEDDNHYYSPYRKKISFDEEGPIDVLATLYSVPKPSFDVDENVTRSDDIPLPKGEASSGKLFSEEDLAVSSDKDAIEKQLVFGPSNRPSNFFPKKTQDVANDKLVKLSPSLRKVRKKASAGHAPDRFHISVKSGRKALEGVKIFFANKDKKIHEEVCTTNRRGLCRFVPSSMTQQAAYFLARKDGYFSKKFILQEVFPEKVELSMEKGFSIDIRTKVNRFKRHFSLPGIGVYVAGSRVGLTDAYGYFNYKHQGDAEDLIEVVLKTSEFEPELISEDFVAYKGAEFVKHYVYPDPPRPKIAVLNLSKTRMRMKSRSDRKFVDQLCLALLAEISNSSIMNLVRVKADRFSNFSDKAEFLESWPNQSFRNEVDIAFWSSFVPHSDGGFLELTAVDPRGSVLGATKKFIHSRVQGTHQKALVRDMLKAIQEYLPYEGYVLAQKGGNVHIKFGGLGKIAPQEREEVELFGTKSLLNGRRKVFGKIGILTVINSDKVAGGESVAVVKSLDRHAHVGRGDLIVLRRGARQRNSELRASKGSRRNKVVRVFGRSKKGSKNVAVMAANIYLNDQWVGVTNKMGLLGRVELEPSTVKNSLLVLSDNYQIGLRNIEGDRQRRFNFELRPTFYEVNIQTVPSGAKLFINNEPYGKTPFSQSIFLATGRKVHVSVKGLAGYFDFESEFPVKKGTLDLTGRNAVVLRKDTLFTSQENLKMGNIDKAISVLKKVRRRDPEFAQAQFELGKIYLNNKEEPAEASRFFSSVTESLRGENHQDNLYLKSRSYEAIALFKSGKNLWAKDRSLALAHYKMAEEVFSKVGRSIYKLKDNGDRRLAEKVHFFDALTKHEISMITKNRADFERASTSWENFLNRGDLQFEKYLFVKAKNYYSFLKRSQGARSENERTL